MTESRSSTILDINTLFFAHQGELIRHLSKILKCPETAADLAQESYLILAKTAQEQTIDHPRGFLFRVASNLALNHLRHNKVAETHAQSSVANDAHNTPSAEHQFVQHQRLERFIQIINELPPRCRDVFILYKVHGMSHKEIATELGISVSGVEKHITKGLNYCRQKLLALEED